MICAQLQINDVIACPLIYASECILLSLFLLRAPLGTHFFFVVIDVSESTKVAVL